MEHINWNKATKEDYSQVKKILDRFEEDYPGRTDRIGSDRLDLEMDLIAVHTTDMPLDFDKLLGFDKVSFYHDVHGINVHLNRKTGKLQHCFVPRCTV